MGLLRARAAYVSDPLQLTDEMNKALLGAAGAAYLALVLVRWHPGERRLVIASCAGCPPVRIVDGRPEEVSVSGKWLGSFPETHTDVLEYHPALGEILALHSDGIADQCEMEDSDEHYGNERFCAALTACSALPLEHAVLSVFRDIDAYRRETPITDDQTLVLVPNLLTAVHHGDAGFGTLTQCESMQTS